MKSIKSIIVAALMVAGVTGAQATLITGGIGFSGAFSATSTDLSTANLQISFPSAVLVNATTGAFSSVAIGSSVTMYQPLQVNPAVLPASALWQVGGFSFTLSTINQKDVTASTITLYGDGTLSGNSYENTSGTWLATFNSLGQGTLTFSSSTASVPDGGTTVMLLGGALAGLGLLRKKLTA